MPDGTSLQSETGRLLRVLLKHARDAFVSPESIARQWRSLGYRAPPDYDGACRQSDALGELLEHLEVQVSWASGEDGGMDSIYVRDASILCDAGAILCRMGKAARRGEPEALAGDYTRLGVPLRGSVVGDGTLEGGDVLWLGPRTVAVGRGYRTNDEGVRQLKALLADSVDEVVTVPLPHWRGPDDVFHLMSMISPVAPDLALVYSPLLPVPFRQDLLARGIGLVEVPDEELESMGCNVLAVAPGVVVALSGNPETGRRLEAAGVEVHTYEGSEISVRGSGGPTCLTRPLERA